MSTRDAVRNPPAWENDPRFFQAIVEHASDAVLIANDDSVYVHANPAACALVGLPCEQVLGRHIADFFEMAEGEPVIEAWSTFLSGGAREGLCVVHRADGAVRYAQFRATANFIPGLHLSILRDVTTQREILAKLDRNNRRLHFLAQTTSTLLAQTDPQTLLRNTFAQLSAELDLEVYFHYALAEDGRRLHLESYAGVSEDVAARFEWLDLGEGVSGAVARDGEVRKFEHVVQSTDSVAARLNELGVSAYVAKALFVGSELIGTLGFGTRAREEFLPEELEVMQVITNEVATALQRARLISNLEKANGELRERNQELQRSNTEVVQFAYAVGHDLRAPLRTIASFAQLLQNRLRSGGAGVDECISFINDAVRGMNAFLEDLLTYAQAGRGVPRAPGLIAMDTVVDWALMNLHASISDSGAVITRDPLPQVIADQAQMTQLFQNLIGNAIKYCGSEPPRIHISAERVDHEWIFSVADNGMGIEEQYLESVFGVFKRLHGKDIPGTGLGLAICKRMVENHGGRIWAESTMGKGTTFRFSLAA